MGKVWSKFYTYTLSKSFILQFSSIKEKFNIIRIILYIMNILNS